MIACPKCNDPMVLRNGKHGEFYYCVYHGTISKRVADFLIRKQPSSKTGHMYQYAPTHDDVLLQAITRTGMAIGRHMDDLGLLAEWEVDNEATADRDEDSWMNVRPY